MVAPVSEVAVVRNLHGGKAGFAQSCLEIERDSSEAGRKENEHLIERTKESRSRKCRERLRRVVAAQGAHDRDRHHDQTVRSQEAVPPRWVAEVDDIDAVTSA